MQRSPSRAATRRPFPALARATALTAVTAALVGATVAASPAGAAPAASSPAGPRTTTPGLPPPGRFVAVAPVRAVERQGIGPGATYTADLSPYVSATATAVVLNLTVVNPSEAGYLTVYPAGELRPTASNINKATDETRSNSVTVAVADNGPRAVDIYNQAGISNVIVDLVGYYDPTPASGVDAAAYRSYSAPFRVFDSRDGDGPLVPGDVLDADLPAPAGVSGVTAVAATVTAVDPRGGGFLTTWNGRDAEPATSTVNYGYDAATPNFAVIPAYQDESGIHFAVGDHANSTDVAVDVVGLYATAVGEGGLVYSPVSPERLSDTRRTGILGPDQSYATSVASTDTYAAANLNVTAVDASAQTFLSVYPAGATRPFVSTANPARGQVVATATQTGLTFATYRVYNSQGFIDVVADLEGLFSTEDGAAAHPALPTPGRVSATRR